MSIQEMIKQAREEGIAQEFVVYANIGNNTDEPIVCSAEEADNAGVTVVNVEYIEINAFYKVMHIWAEVSYDTSPIKCYIVQWEFYRNWRCERVYYYTTDKAKAQAKMDWAESMPGIYGEEMRTITTTRKALQKMFDELDKDTIRLNGYTVDSFQV